MSDSAAYVVGWELRSGLLGGNDVVNARSEKQARRVVRRRHGLLSTRITAVQKVNA